jgi:mitogen-activated protein kinase 7
MLLLFVFCFNKALDLLEKLLKFDPHLRISVEGALEHPYLAEYHDLDREPVSTPFDFAFEQLDNTSDMKQEIARQVAGFRAHRAVGQQRASLRSFF